MSVENVTLRLITKENELECINLKPRDEQMNLVATNSDSLIHAIKETTSNPYGIYAEDQMVGFILFDNEIYSDGYYWILRLMIDERYQGRGYAKQAIREVINKLKAEWIANRLECLMYRITLWRTPYIKLPVFWTQAKLKITETLY